MGVIVSSIFILTLVFAMVFVLFAMLAKVFVTMIRMWPRLWITCFTLAAVVVLIQALAGLE